MKTFDRVPPLVALIATLLLLSAVPSSARERGPIAPKQTPADSALAAAAPEKPSGEVRVVYYQGNVEVHDTSGSLPVTFGMLIDSTHTVVVGRGGAVQLAVDGKILTLERPTRVRLREVVRRATGEPNEELMAALRSLALHGDMIASTTINPARLQVAVVAAIAPTARAASASSTGMLVPLEPRSTAVTRGPLRFRWLQSAHGATYRVVVRDRYDQEVFRHETTDTNFTWESAVLFAGSEYSWTLTRADDSSQVATSTFHRLDDLRGMRLEGGESRIRLALGSENPALPIVLGSHFALHGCYADAARQFTIAAFKTPEHFDRCLRLAREQYGTNIGLSARELEHVQTLGAITMTTP